MSLELLATLALAGALGGLAAGVLGFGGGVVMFPLLFYLPPLLGSGKLDTQTVAAIVVSQVFFATLIGGAAHWRSGRVQPRLTLEAGLVSAAGSFFGGIASKWVSEGFLLVLFGIVTLLVTMMMFLRGPTEEQENTPAGKVRVAKGPLAFLSSLVGVIVGFLGAGNFIFVPLLIYVFKVPTRLAIGSSLFIAMLNTSAGFMAKLITAQIPFLPASVVVIGAGAGALVGEWSHRKISSRVLRCIYASMVVIITVRVWITLLGPG